MAFHLMTKIPAVLCLMSIIFAVTEGSPSHIFEEHPGTPSMPIEENLPKSEINTDGDAVVSIKFAFHVLFPIFHLKEKKDNM